MTHDDTCPDHNTLSPSLADFKTVLSPPQSADEIGRIADFRVLRLLGIGGMAAVFEAEDTRLKRRVALKVLHPAIAAKPGSNRRFLREAQSGRTQARARRDDPSGGIARGDAVPGPGIAPR